VLQVRNTPKSSFVGISRHFIPLEPKNAARFLALFGGGGGSREPTPHHFGAGNGSEAAFGASAGGTGSGLGVGWPAGGDGGFGTSGCGSSHRYGLID